MLRVEAVIVNHNTSRFAELALRSLRARNHDPAVEVSCTVVDNHSSDDVAALQRAARECGADFVTSRWPAATKRVNTHGDVLRDFVLDHPDCDAFLFLDADIWFCRDDSVAAMAGELESADDVWAVQARFSWDGVCENPKGSWGPDHGRNLEHLVHLGTRRVFGELNDHERSRPPDGFHSGTIMPRCHPACALVRNTPTLRRVADQIGFSCGWLWSEDHELGGFCDTMALATQAMGVAGWRFVLSDEFVGHFFNVSYDPPEVVSRKRERCETYLAALRERP